MHVGRWDTTPAETMANHVWAAVCRVWCVRRHGKGNSFETFYELSSFHWISSAQTLQMNKFHGVSVRHRHTHTHARQTCAITIKISKRSNVNLQCARHKSFGSVLPSGKRVQKGETCYYGYIIVKNVLRCLCRGGLAPARNVLPEDTYRQVSRTVSGWATERVLDVQQCENVRHFHSKWIYFPPLDHTNTLTHTHSYAIHATISVNKYRKHLSSSLNARFSNESVDYVCVPNDFRHFQSVFSLSSLFLSVSLCLSSEEKRRRFFSRFREL